MAAAAWSQQDLRQLLAKFGLDAKAPMSALAMELLPEPNGNFGDPLRGDLGEVRILRTSPLVPIGTDCC
jgi:hypothetical protein